MYVCMYICSMFNVNIYIYTYIYIYKYIYIYIYIYISKIRHLLLNKLYFGFFQTFEDSIK